MPVDPTRESWKPGMPFDLAVKEIEYIKGLAREMGGPQRVTRQHDGGRLTIRERVEQFVDPGSFIEAGPLVGATLPKLPPAAGYLVAHARIDDSQSPALERRAS